MRRPAGVGPVEFAVMMVVSHYTSRAQALSALILHRAAAFFAPFPVSVLAFPVVAKRSLLRAERKPVKGRCHEVSLRRGSRRKRAEIAPSHVPRRVRAPFERGSRRSRVGIVLRSPPAARPEIADILENNPPSRLRRTASFQKGGFFLSFMTAGKRKASVPIGPLGAFGQVSGKRRRFFS